MRHKPSPAPDPDAPEVLKLTIELKSGKFYTELVCPLKQSPTEVEDIMKRWLDMVQMAIKMGVTAMDATFKDDANEDQR